MLVGMKGDIKKYINHFLGKIGSSRRDSDQWPRLRFSCHDLDLSVELVYIRHPTLCLKIEHPSFLRRIRKPLTGKK